MSETEKTPLSETGQSCAHLHVKWVEEQDPFTKCYTGWWECFDCRTEFMRVPVHKYEIEELERENNANKALLKDAAMQVTEKEAEVTRLREALKSAHELAEYGLDNGDYEEGSTMWQLEADLRAALAASAPQAAPTKPEYPKPCGLCPGQIESREDLEWHGLGNCVPICERCSGSGIEPTEKAAPREIPIGAVIPNWGKVIKRGPAYWVIQMQGYPSSAAVAVDAGMLEALYAEQAGTTQTDGSGK